MNKFDDFSKHAFLYLATLGAVAIGVALGAPADVLSPISQGLGMALPALLGGHAVAQIAGAWQGGDGAANSKP